MSNAKNHNTTINQLAQRYADGEMDRSTYQALRAELLEKLVLSPRHKPINDAAQTESKTQPITEPIPATKAEPEPQEELPLARILITAAVLLLVFIGTIYLFFLL
jgi:hypothetical protein